MIRQSIEPGTKVFHERFGIGTFKGFEMAGAYTGFALIEFEEHHGITLISRKRLTEIEGRYSLSDG